MEQNQTPQPLHADFKKRRDQKNRMVVSLIFAGVILIWAVTMLKFNPEAFRNVIGPHSEPAAENTQTLHEGGKDAQ